MMMQRVKVNQEDIQLFLKKAKSRIRSAEALLGIGQYNDAISRAYYAFFDGSRAALLSKGFLIKTHGGLKAMFNKYFIKTGEMPVKFARYLQKAFDARQAADYHVRLKFNKESVEVAIESAKEFVKEIEKIINKK